MKTHTFSVHCTVTVKLKDDEDPLAVCEELEDELFTMGIGRGDCDCPIVDWEGENE